MNKEAKYITIGILTILLALTIIAIMSCVRSSTGEGIPFYRCSGYTGGKIMETVYSKMGFHTTSDPNSATVYLPCGYTLVEKELRDHNPANKQVVLGIPGCDRIVSKNGLWQVLSEAYGRDSASQLVPRSYVTTSERDLQYLKREYNPSQIYIMKKNLQRQQGLQLTTELAEMLDSSKKGYAVIQEYLMNPLLIDGRKFDMRVYLLIICRKGKQEYYRHSQGRCHYSGSRFSTTDLSRDIHIPTGYKEDAQFKATHPETLQDLQRYLGSRGDTFFQRLDENLATCCRAFSSVLAKDQRYNNTVQCQLFGLDYLSDNQLRPVLIEINKGPEMSWSSEVEKKYKTKIAIDMFNLLGYATTDTANEFKLLK